MGNEMTGYASIDRPWKKYYSEEVMTRKLSDMSLYDMFLESGKKYKDGKFLLWFYGTFYTYKMMLYRIDRLADALRKNGVKKGDYVGVAAFIDPEVITLLYAINKVGAIVDLINPFEDENLFCDNITKVNMNTIFTADMFANKIAYIKDERRPKNIIVLSPLDSMNFISKFVSRFFGLKRMHVSKELKTRSFLEFLASGDVKNTTPFEKVNGDDPAVVFPTSGTSGHSKGALLSNNAINNNMEQFFIGSSNAADNESALCAIPMFHAFAITTSVHGPIMKGMRIAMEFPSEKTLLKGFSIHKVNHVAFMPSIWETFLNYNDERIDLSNLVDPITGSDSLPPELEDKINEYLEKHGSKYPILNGYGLTEVCAACSVNTYKYRKKSSLGIPFCQTTIAIFDKETGKEVKYGEIGEICIKTISMMSKYVANEEETKKALRIHEDGTLWFHSGDLGYMDSDGFLYYKARKSRSFYYQYGENKGVAFKLDYGDIEKVYEDNEYAEKVVASPKPDEYHYNVPVLFIELKEQYKKEKQDEMIEIFKKIANEKLEEHLRPVEYRIIDKMPLTIFRKADYKKIDAMV